MEKIETKRLMIRPPKEEDFDKIFSIHADPKANLYNPNGPETNRENFREVFHSWMEHHQKHGFGYYVLVDKTDGDVFGVVGLRFTSLQEKEYLNLYYRIHPEKMRKGFVKEGAQEIIHFVLKKLKGQYPVVALTRADNVPSRKTAESLQLKYDSQWDDLYGKGNVYYFSTNHSI